MNSNELTVPKIIESMMAQLLDDLSLDKIARIVGMDGVEFAGHVVALAESGEISLIKTLKRQYNKYNSFACAVDYFADKDGTTLEAYMSMPVGGGRTVGEAWVLFAQHYGTHLRKKALGKAAVV